jgi:hypothetical protein
MVPDDDETLRARLLNEIHRQPSTAHPRRTKTRQLVQARYHWPGWRKFVDRYVRNCLKCRRAENPRDRVNESSAYTWQTIIFFFFFIYFYSFYFRGVLSVLCPNSSPYYALILIRTMP